MWHLILISFSISMEHNVFILFNGSNLSLSIFPPSSHSRIQSRKSHRVQIFSGIKWTVRFCWPFYATAYIVNGQFGICYCNCWLYGQCFSCTQKMKRKIKNLFTINYADIFTVTDLWYVKSGSIHKESFATYNMRLLSVCIAIRQVSLWHVRSHESNVCSVKHVFRWAWFAGSEKKAPNERPNWIKSKIKSIGNWLIDYVLIKIKIEIKSINVSIKYSSLQTQELSFFCLHKSH